MITRCRNCGKDVMIEWPMMWRYKIEETYFCSWSCIQAWRRGETKQKELKEVPELFNSRTEMLDRVIEEIQAERDPLAMLLEHGYTSPGQSFIGLRAWAKKNAPEKAAQLPENLKVWKKEKNIKPKIETPEKVIVPAAQVLDPDAETPEAPKAKITKPVNYDGFTVREVEKNYGRYNYQETTHGGYLDYESLGGDELSMPIEQWREFLAELHEAARVLGVEL